MNVSIEKLDFMENKIERSIRLLWWVIFLSLFVGLFFFGYLLGVYFWGSLQNISYLGEAVGGIVSSVWSLTGLLLIYKAFLGQRLQLIIQQKELVINRVSIEQNNEEIALTRKEIELQNLTISKERFDSLFFHMLKLHAEITNECKSFIIVKEIKEGESEQDKLSSGFYSIYYTLWECFYDIQNEDSRTELEKINISYTIFKNKTNDVLTHYFRNLFYLVKVVDDSPFSDSDKQMYINLVSSHFSTYEILLIFYYVLSKQGIHLFPYVKKHNMLNSLSSTDLFNVKHMEIYNGL